MRRIASFLVFLMVVVVFSTAVSSHPIQKYQVKTTQEDQIKGRLALVVTFDAINYTVFQQALENGELPTFEKIINSGYMVLGKTIVPSATTAAWAAFATGAPPEKNGVVYTYAVNTTQYRSTPSGVAPTTVGYSDLIKAETLTEVLNQYNVPMGFIYTEKKVSVFFGQNGSPTIEVFYPEPYDPHDPALPLLAREAYIAQLIRNTTGVIKALKDQIMEGGRALVVLDFPEPDSTGHTFGPLSSKYHDMLVAMDRQLASLVDYLNTSGLWDRTLLVMFTDHSMFQVDPQLSVVDSSGKHIVGLPVEHTIVPAGTLVYIYLKRLGDMGLAVNYLRNMSWVQGIWTRISMDGVNGTLGDLGLNSEYAGDIVVSIKSPYYAYPFESRGAHGGVNTRTVPFIFSGGMVNKSTTVEDVSILDMAPTLAGFLGVRAPKDAVGRDLKVYSNFVDLDLKVNPRVGEIGKSIEVSVKYSFAYIPENGKIVIKVLDANGDEVQSEDEYVGAKEAFVNKTIKIDKEGQYTIIASAVVNGEEWLSRSTQILIVSLEAPSNQPIVNAGLAIAIVFGVLTAIVPVLIKKFLWRAQE